MKFGVCVGTDVENIRYIKEVGFDYAETNCQQIVSKPMEHIEAMKAVGLPILSANCFIAHRVIGKDKNEAVLKEYLATLFERSEYLGIEYLVFGASGSRKIKEDEPMTVEEARAQVVDFLKNLVVPVAEKHGIVVAIEPLRPAECNVINTVKDGIEIAKAVGSPYVRVLADVAHMFAQNESLEELADMGEWLVHAHTSNPNPDPKLDIKRIYPAPGDGFDQNSFIAPLKAAGVKQCSIEGSCVNDFRTEIKIAYDVLKELR